jgi:hypothetical protein
MDHHSSLWIYDPHHFWSVLSTFRLLPLFWSSQAAFPLLQRQQYDPVICTTSMRAMFIEDTLLELTGYALGKTAIMFAEEADCIRVNTISSFEATQIFGALPLCMDCGLCRSLQAQLSSLHHHVTSLVSYCGRAMAISRGPMDEER